MTKALPRSHWYRLRRILIPVAAALCACSGTSDSTPTARVPARSINNVAYGTDPAQVMDVRLPADRSSTTAVVVFIHGGGWEGGDKSIFTAADLSAFTARGYATVNINYRLSSVPRALHDPIMSNDVTAAIDYVAARAVEYQVASSTFAVVGHSAGGHLALLAGYKYNPSGRIKAVASLAGPTNLIAPDFLAIPTIRELIERYLGVTMAAQPARWTQASPLSVATASSPPTILLQGRLDGLVPYTQAESLNARLVALRVPVDYRLFPTYDHVLNYLARNQFGDDIWNPALAWFATHLK